MYTEATRNIPVNELFSVDFFEDDFFDDLRYDSRSYYGEIDSDYVYDAAYEKEEREFAAEKQIESEIERDKEREAWEQLRDHNNARFEELEDEYDPV